jgi:hypothetical protein
MHAAHPGPPKSRPPVYDGTELHVHPHRAVGITRGERKLVCVFLRRYIVWCAKARRFDRLRNAMDLLVEVAACRTGSGDAGPVTLPN